MSSIWRDRVICTEVTPSKGPGAVVAMAVVRIGKTLTIHNVTIWQGRAGEPMVTLPRTIKLHDDALR